MIEQNKKPFAIGYWYITHKDLLRKIAKYAAIGVIAIIWLNFGVKAIDYIININRTKQAITDIATDIVNYDVMGQPKEIAIIQTNVVNRSTGKYDLFARLQNPNNYWSADVVTYQFQVNGNSLTEQTTYILPGQEKFIAETNVSITGSASNADINIINVQWKGQREKLPETDFEFSEVQIAPVEFEDDTSGSYSRLTATAFNKSIYGFKDIEAVVLLTSQGAVVGVGTVNLQNFLSSESRQIEFIWPRKFPYNPKTEFNINTDVRDEANLILTSQE
jgi:hypothetical protein